MLVSDIITRVKRQFGDESGVQLTDDDIIRYINEGQRQIVMQNEGLLETVATSNAVANQQEYTIPTNSLIVRSISYKGPDDAAYYKLKGMSMPQLDEYMDGWSNTASTGVPEVYTIFGSNIIMFPIPDRSQTNAIKIFYNRTPVDVVDGTSTPDLPLLYHDALTKQCLQLAYELDEDWEAAAAKATQLDADVAILRGRDDWKQQDVYPLITIRYEDQD